MDLLRRSMMLLCIAVAAIGHAQERNALPDPNEALAGAPHLAEGEAAVIRGDGSRWTIVARIRVADWPRLAQ